MFADSPPPGMILRYGLRPGCEPTGATKVIEGVEFVEIGPGCFRMGSTHLAEGGDWLGKVCGKVGLPWGERPEPSREMPVHWVEFPRGFWIARTELTNELYEAFDRKRERSESSPGDRDPVVEVSWEDAKRYCAWLSEKSGLAIRLPSESEWECACRGGPEREFCFDEGEKLSNYAWCVANSKSRACEVGTRRANAWGLFDFHGNVWEWCEDIWHDQYQGSPTDGTAWVEGGSQLQIDRGGSWHDPAEYCRSASRCWRHPSLRANDIGFRLAFSPPGD